MTLQEYEAPQPGSWGRSIKWSALGLAGKQGVVALFTLLLARLLGPDAYGLVAQAGVYIVLTTLLLDQGIAAALTSSGTISRRVVGAAATINIVLSIVLGAVTLAVAPFVADFFRSPELTEVVRVLGVALLLKGVAIVPRTLLARNLNFKAIALADLSGSVSGGIVGVTMAVTGFDYWSLVGQTLAMDFITVILLVSFARPPRPNLQMAAIKPYLGFSSRVFGSNLLSYGAGNTDNLLIGRFLGAPALASYDVAFRLLRMPVDMSGQILSRVLFPVISGKRHRGEPVGPVVIRSVRNVSLFTFPLMAALGASATEVVPLVLGTEWLDVIPLLMVFAFSGARQSVTTINTPVMLGLGKARTQFRFSVCAAAVQIGAVVIGLNWGAIGVAWGYTLAGVLLTPLIAFLQKRHSQVTYSGLLGAVWPAFHASLWLIAAYTAVSLVIVDNDIARLIAGVGVGTLAYVAVIGVAHRKSGRLAIADLRTIVRRRAS